MIIPSFSLVCNNGYDGSGVNCVKKESQDFLLYNESEYNLEKIEDFSLYSLKYKMKKEEKKQHLYFIYKYIIWLLTDKRIGG